MTDDTALYDDGPARIDAEGLLLRRYYFPLGRPRRVRWTELRGYERLPLTARSGRYRGWGSSRLDRWFQLDIRRSRKREMVVLAVPGRVSPVVRPDDPDAVCALLDDRLRAGGG